MSVIMFIDVRLLSKHAKNRSKIMIFDDFLKGLNKHMNAEAVTDCHGPTRWSQQPSKTQSKSLLRHLTRL